MNIKKLKKLQKLDDFKEVLLPLSKFNIVLIEDDPEVSELLKNSLKNAGHDVNAAQNYASVQRILAAAQAPPDIIIADLNFSEQSNGMKLAIKFREKFDHPIPIIVLTGDVTKNTSRRISQEGCIHISKPVIPIDLHIEINQLINDTESWDNLSKPLSGKDAVIISIIEDDASLAETLCSELKEDGNSVNIYMTCEEFLKDYSPGGEQCLILDAYLPGMTGIEFLKHLKETNNDIPTIIITGYGDTQIAVDAMKLGAFNFFDKPINIEELRESVFSALELSKNRNEHEIYLKSVAIRYSRLTPRQVEVMHLVLEGHPNKNIAADLGISQRTVENHRAAVMSKTQSKTLPDLVRFSAAASKLNLE